MLGADLRVRVSVTATLVPRRFSPPFVGTTVLVPQVRGVKARSSEKGTGINEDVLARLKAAEDEAAMLRRKLAAAQQGALQEDIIQVKPKRIDSVDNRETVFDVTGKKGRSSSAWLSEADVDFFTGGAPGETSSKDTPDPEYQATLQKRLVIGGLLTLGLGAFGLIPTEQLRLKPAKPLYFYVVPLLRVKDLLTDCRALVEDADWTTVRILLPRVSGPPNNARENLENIVALLDDSKTAEKAQQLSSEFLEYMNSIDYNKYYDAMPNRVLSGSEVAKFAEFSGMALKAAESRLDAFLALVPAQARADARAQMELY